ncbi:MAG: cytochrome c biogenesis protein CcsA [Bradyrhizobiaceae bacterium]|nr:cytochrome c biogenesis protein CcsA [Bradyrhizobiaceae bacterium]
MKFAIMMAATILGTVAGLLPLRKSVATQYPAWWRVIAIVAVIITSLLAILPPTAGTVTDAVIAGRADSSAVVPILVKPLGDGAWADARDANVVIVINGVAGKQINETWTTAVVDVQRSTSDQVFTGLRIVAHDPWITMPYIVGLADRARIIFFHVPMSWVATIAYLIAMIYGIKYLRSRSMDHDRMSMALNSVATLYGILATVTGAVWARFNWGMFWNWDPKQTAIFLVLLIYGAYFLLRGSIDDPERRARLSAVYSILGFVSVPFLFFILPRLMPGLHPGSSDDSTAGPMLSLKSDALNTTKQWVFGLALFAFTMVYFWLVNLRVRLAKLQDTASSTRQ